jgi:hypothetical protein
LTEREVLHIVVNNNRLLSPAIKRKSRIVVSSQSVNNMDKIKGNPLVEPTPEKGRTGNALMDSDIEIKNILALPTPPSTKRRVVANFASTELAGAQNVYSPAQTTLTTSAHVPLILSSTAAGVSVIDCQHNLYESLL